MTPAEIEQQARQLPDDERARLAQLLLETLPGATWAEFQDEWRQEIEGRVKADEQGMLETYTATEVFAEARGLCQ